MEKIASSCPEHGTKRLDFFLFIRWDRSIPPLFCLFCQKVPFDFTRGYRHNQAPIGQVPKIGRDYIGVAVYPIIYLANRHWLKLGSQKG